MTCETGLENLELESFLTTWDNVKFGGRDFEKRFFNIISDVVEPQPAQDIEISC